MSVFNQAFYHNAIRNYTIAFGTLFQKLQVLQYDPAGNELSRVTCPISYSPKEKWVQRLFGDPNLTRQPAITYPRLAFETTGFTYAADRKLSVHQKIFVGGPDANNAYAVYNPVAYDIGFNLYIVTKGQDDLFQVIEQILPAFVPDYTITMKSEVKNMNLSFDVPIIMNGIQKDDNYETAFDDHRTVLATISFTMRAYLFGPVREQGLIKSVDIDVGQLNGNSRYASINVVPFIPGVALDDIYSTDPWTAQTTIEELFP